MNIAVQNGDENKIHSLLSKARRFINAKEDFIIGKNCAFTFEPRLLSSDRSEFPMFSFHTIIQLIEGKIIVVSNFNGVINELGMQWLYK